MKKTVALIVILFTLFLSFGSEPKLALVLSGGGARGLSHISVLKELDRRGIVPDIIVGTSMGSLMGGLYAAGYTGEEIYDVISSMSLNEHLYHSYLAEEEDDIPNPFSPFNTNMFTLTLGKTEEGGGVLDDREVLSLMKRLVVKVSDKEDFDELSIPYRAVATDIIHARKMVFDSGPLYLAMRSSMSIPLVFAPVEAGGSYLMDGGLEDNMPVDVAKSLGATHVLAVDVDDKMRSHGSPEYDLTSVIGAFAAFEDYLTTRSTLESYNISDWVIAPDVCSASAFDYDVVDFMVKAGDEEVERNQWVFDEIEKIFGGGKKRSLYDDITPLKIESIRTVGIPNGYEGMFTEFIGEDLDFDSLADIEVAAEKVRKHSGLRRITVDTSGPVVIITGEEGETFKSLSLSIGHSGDFGIRYDGGDLFIVSNPDIAVSGKLLMAPSVNLTFAVSADQGLDAGLGIEYAMPMRSYVTAGIILSYGEVSWQSVHGTPDYTFSGGSFKLTGNLGYAYVLDNRFRLDLTAFIDWNYISDSDNSLFGAFGAAASIKYPYISGSAVFVFGYDSGDGIFGYSADVSLDAKVGTGCKFIGSVEASTVRRPLSLAEAYRVGKTGVRTTDYLLGQIGAEIPCFKSWYTEIGAYAEAFNSGTVDFTYKRRISEFVPFSEINDWDAGGYISFGINMKTLRASLDLYASVSGRVSFLLSVKK